MTNQSSKCLRLTLSQIICLNCSKQSATLSNILRNSPSFFLIIFSDYLQKQRLCVFSQSSGTRFLKSPTMWSPERHHKGRNMAISCRLLQTRLPGWQCKIRVASLFKLSLPSVLHINKTLTMYGTEYPATVLPAWAPLMYHENWCRTVSHSTGQTDCASKHQPSTCTKKEKGKKKIFIWKCPINIIHMFSSLALQTSYGTDLPVFGTQLSDVLYLEN